jgi:hypothetical protein
MRQAERSKVVRSPYSQPIGRSWGPRLFLSPIGSARSRAGGAFEVILRGAGDYYVSSVPRGLADQLQVPAVLDQLSRTARVVRVNEGESIRVDVTAAEP